MDLETYLHQAPPHIAIMSLLWKDVPPEVILDVGACEGEDSLRYLSLFPQTRVIAFEPLPANIAKIATVIPEHDKHRFQLVSTAVAGSDGTRRFHVSSGRPPGVPDSDWNYGNKSSSLLNPSDLMHKIHGWLRFDEVISVEAVTMPTIFKRFDLGLVNLIHLDVQGAELEILKASAEVLPRVQSVWLEVSERPIYENQALVGDVEVFMRNAGFSKVLDLRSEGFGDQLYVQPSLLSIRHN